MNIRKGLFKIYWIVEGILTPGLKYSQFLYEDVLNPYVTIGVKWLDVGCGRSILPAWRGDVERSLVQRCGMVTGIDYSLGSLKQHETISAVVNGDVTDLPYATASFGLVTANMVVEHLQRAEDQFREINRVLQPGGIFIFHTPNVLGYDTIIARLIPERWKKTFARIVEARGASDVFPTFYRANSRKRINELASAAGFETVKIKMIVSTANFVVCPPLVVPELMWIRLLRTRMFQELRTNIIAVLRKQSELEARVA